MVDDFCQARKAENTDPRTNCAVKYATARGHLRMGGHQHHHGTADVGPIQMHHDFQGKAPWVDSACADCPGFLVLGSAPALASTFSSEPQIVPLG